MTSVCAAKKSDCVKTEEGNGAKIDNSEREAGAVSKLTIGQGSDGHLI